MMIMLLFHLDHDSNGNIRARNIKLLKSSKPERVQGVVCSLKDNYGFIERSDIVKEIFFHFSEFKGNINELLLGDDVEFGIQSRNVSAHLYERPGFFLRLRLIAVVFVTGQRGGHLH